MSGTSKAGPPEGHDLELAASVDGSVQQNVPLPPPPQVNGVLAGMIDSARAGGGPSHSLNVNASNASADPPGGYGSQYAPSALPSALRFASSSHPTACLFHVLFKALALALYVLGPKMGMRDNLVTVLCVLLLAADFWVVKNVTGRLLVGLRWWNRVDPVTGNTSWIFENKAPGGTGEGNTFDYRFFWGVLYLAPLLWGLFSVSAVLFLRFNCFVSLACALVLSSSNVYGYYKCSADQREKWNQWMDRGARMGVSAMLRGNMFGWLRNRAAGGGGGMQSVPQQEPNIMPGTFA